jgi:ABC-type transporter Mla subunit MlaD
MSRIVWIIAAVIVIVLGYVFLTGEEEVVPPEPAVESSTEAPLEEAGDAADETGDALNDAADAASDAAGNAVEGASEAAGDAADAVGNAAENAQEDVGQALENTGEAIQPEDQPTLEDDVRGMADEEAIQNGQ